MTYKPKLAPYDPEITWTNYPGAVCLEVKSTEQLDDHSAPPPSPPLTRHSCFQPLGLAPNCIYTHKPCFGKAPETDYKDDTCVSATFISSSPLP